MNQFDVLGGIAVRSVLTAEFRKTQALLFSEEVGGLRLRGDRIPHGPSLTNQLLL